MTALEDRCRDLYSVFSGYRVTLPVGGCPCCVPRVRAEFFEHDSFASLGMRDLDTYSRKAITTIGTITDFKHFLPRILEVAATRPDEFTSLEVTFARLELADWHDWPDVERTAVQRFLDAFWADCLNREGHEDSADSALAALGQCCRTVVPYLAQWMASPSGAAACHLAYFLLVNRESVGSANRLSNPFWEERPEQAAEVLAWLATDAPRQYLRERVALLQGELWGVPLRQRVQDVL